MRDHANDDNCASPDREHAPPRCDSGHTDDSAAMRLVRSDGDGEQPKLARWPAEHTRICPVDVHAASVATPELEGD
jgi:hypothetical protein